MSHLRQVQDGVDVVHRATRHAGRIHPGRPTLSGVMAQDLVEHAGQCVTVLTAQRVAGKARIGK